MEEIKNDIDYFENRLIYQSFQLLSTWYLYMYIYLYMYKRGKMEKLTQQIPNPN